MFICSKGETPDVRYYIRGLFLFCGEVNRLVLERNCTRQLTVQEAEIIMI